MCDLIKDFVKAFFAGVLIGISCVLFLSVDNAIIGSLMFSVGLLAILVLKLYLFTGKAPYIVVNKPKYCFTVIVTWLGNFAGTYIIATLIKYTRVSEQILNKCATLVEAKLADSLLSLFILSVFCGALMFIAVNTYNTYKENIFAGTLLLILCVGTFILSGFEHSVADMFYFTLAKPGIEWLSQLMIVSVGNIVGGNLFCLTKKLN